MKKIHYTDRYLLNPYHPVTVFVIGAGGTGSQVATGLARISVALQALGHPVLYYIHSGEGLQRREQEIRFHFDSGPFFDIIPSLTVNRRKNRRIPCIYWAAAIFSLLRTIVIYSFPLQI